MVIDINSNFSSGASGASRSRTAAPVSEKPASAAPAPGDSVARDQVVLSEQAQGLKKLQSTISSLPDIDSDRVSALRQAIAEGKFNINAERIAENMLNQEDLLR